MVNIFLENYYSFKPFKNTVRNLITKNGEIKAVSDMSYLKEFERWVDVKFLFLPTITCNGI